MAGRDLEQVTGTDLEFGVVGQFDSKTALEGHPDVVVSARLRARDGLDVDRPAPARLLGHPSDDDVV